MQVMIAASWPVVQPAGGKEAYSLASLIKSEAWIWPVSMCREVWREKESAQAAEVEAAIAYQ